MVYAETVTYCLIKFFPFRKWIENVSAIAAFITPTTIQFFLLSATVSSAVSSSDLHFHLDLMNTHCINALHIPAHRGKNNCVKKLN